MAQLEPYWPFIIMAINGLIAGWIVGQILGGGGFLRNLVVGVIGAVVGGALVQQGWLTLPASITDITNLVPYGTQILISTIGAAIVVLLARFLGGR
ncbi:MAG: GlsB/YeaQ/YmgE family stress response membrane protein [Hyphomicrobiaceae bacterium]